MELVLLIGIQASGKSTFCRTHLFDTHLRLSLDLVRTRGRERWLFEACLAAGQRVVVDNTNVRAAERAAYIGPARAAGFRVVGHVFVPDVRGALARNAARTGRARVPAAGLVGTYKRLEPPAWAEGFDALTGVWLAGDGGFRTEAWTPGEPWRSALPRPDGAAGGRA
jgi:predicted kinase